VGVLAMLMGAFVFAPSASATTPGVNGRIVFSANATGTYQLYTVRPDGTGLRQITHAALFAGSPDWSPNGRRIAFSFGIGFDYAGIAIIHPDGSHRRMVPTVPETVCDCEPAYTPGGGRIVFSSLIPSELQDLILSERVDGSHRHLVDFQSDDSPGDPNVSPDGSTVTIAFSYGGDAPDDAAGRMLFRKSIDGGFEQNVLPLKAYVGNKHDWAPNGERILFTGNAYVNGEPANIATVKPDGSDIRWLTHSADPQRTFDAGSYSPDGRWIVYRLEDHGQYALMRMHPDGTHKHVILPFSNLRPLDIDWGPHPTP